MKRLIFFLIILVSALLRIYQIGSIPPSLTWDETAWGYNAYVLGIDGRDEFGKYLPLQYIESFGDFKPPLYAYLTIIPVKIFGLTEFMRIEPSEEKSRKRKWLIPTIKAILKYDKFYFPFYLKIGFKKII